MPIPFRALLFDFDGTLADSYDAITASVNHVRSLHGLPPLPEIARFAPPPSPEPAGPILRRAGELLAGAGRPLILAGRGSRNPEAWQQRVALAEAIGARVMTDRKSGATFPTDHPLHVDGTAPIVEADVILSLDWVDLAGTLRTTHAGKPVTAKIIQVSVDQYVHNGWSMDYQGLPPSDLCLLAEPDSALAPLLATVKDLRPNPPPLPAPSPRRGPPPASALTRSSSTRRFRSAGSGTSSTPRTRSCSTAPK